MEQEKSTSVDEIVAQWKREKKEGKNTSLQEYLERYPEYAKELREEIEGCELVSALLTIVEQEFGFSKEEAKASFERLKQRIEKMIKGGNQKEEI